jgi:hypothetical protein
VGVNFKLGLFPALNATYSSIEGVCWVIIDFISFVEYGEVDTGFCVKTEAKLSFVLFYIIIFNALLDYSPQALSVATEP